MQVCECMNDSSHVFKGRHLEGVSCPICGGPVLPKPYDERKDSNLPYYGDLKKQSSKRKSAITIELNFDDKSKLKLRAIAKHAGALADELDGIDKGIGCDNCGSYHVYETGPEHLACGNCKMQFHKTNAMFYNESPTRLQGSE